VVRCPQKPQTADNHDPGIKIRLGEIALLAVVRHSGAMGGYERQNQAASTALKPSSRASSVSSTGAPPARITLPSDLPGSLKHLDDAQLQRLLDSVTVEINRRSQGASKNETALAAATGASSEAPSAAFRNKTRGIDEIPEGKANLIRASFRAGLKPATIARTFRISQSLVNRILSSTEKPKR
jgi:hypothetical protein